MNQNVLNRSIVLIGPVGAGKSLISSELSKVSGMPVITTDLLRHCPRSIDEIQNRQARIRARINELSGAWHKTTDVDARRAIEQELNHFRNEDWVCDRQIEMRNLLPNLPNYEDMGFNGEVSTYARSLGELAWSFYQKQFENQMLAGIMEQLSTPAILDMGGGMAISLDDDFAVLAEQLYEKSPQLFEKYIDMNWIGFDHVKREISKCPNVVNLVLPTNYASMDKANGNQNINNRFIASGQYEQLATMNIPVEGLVAGNSVNRDRLGQIVNTIQSQNPIM